MSVPFDRIVEAFKLGADARRDSDAPVRVDVRVDSSATPALVDIIRRALVPQTTNALVRVGRLSDREPVKSDTDVVIVITCGSDGLEDSVRDLVVYGCPVVVVAESSVEVPFITYDAPMLGLVSATDECHLLSELAAWILARVRNQTAFAANFAFMREEASSGIVGQAVAANALTGALDFIPGADFPVMTATQVGMMLKLAASHGKPINHERLYDAAGIVACALLLRVLSRALSSRCGALGFVAKSTIAGAGTYTMGRALGALYESGFDYSPLDDAIRGVAAKFQPADGEDAVADLVPVHVSEC